MKVKGGKNRMALFGGKKPKKQEPVQEEVEVVEEPVDEEEEYEEEEEDSEEVEEAVKKQSKIQTVEVPVFLSPADIDRMTWENNQMLKEIWREAKKR